MGVLRTLAPAVIAIALASSGASQDASKPPARAGRATAVQAALVGLLSDPTTADAHRYGARDDGGMTLDCLKMVPARSAGPPYVGVYHSLVGGHFTLHVATSWNLLDWHRTADLDDDAAQGTIAAFGAAGYAVAYEKRLGAEIRLRVRSYRTEADLLAGRYASEFTAPLTLSPTAEGTPSITRAIGGPAPQPSQLMIDFHYFRGEQVDRQASGVLTDFQSWRAWAARAVDRRFASFPIAGNIGDRDSFTFMGRQFTVFEAQRSRGDWSSWRTFLWDDLARQLVPLVVHTDAGSRAFGNPTVTIAQGPSGGTLVFVSQFLFSEGAAAGESGSLIYYRTL